MGLCPFGIGVEEEGFQTVLDTRGQKFQGLGLKMKPPIRVFRDLDGHLFQNNENGWFLELGMFEFPLGILTF